MQEKRKTKLKKIKFNEQTEKDKFINEVITNTIKRSTLIESADKIFNTCTQVYDSWKKNIDSF